MIDYRRLFWRFSKPFGVVVLIFICLNLWLTNLQLQKELSELKEGAGETVLLKPSLKGRSIEFALQPSKVASYEGELVSGKSYATEMDMPRFAMFTSDYMYLLERGLGDRVVERLFGSRGVDIKEVISTADRIVKLSGKKSFKFLFGNVRLLPRSGMHYEVVYKEKNHGENAVLRRLTFWRPFSELRLVQHDKTSFPADKDIKVVPDQVFSTSIDSNQPKIHMLVTVSYDHLSKLSSFLENQFTILAKSSSKANLNYDITVVAFVDTSEKTGYVRRVIDNKLRELKYHVDVDVLPLVGKNFSRGFGLHSAIKSIGAKFGNDSLIFTTDVDVITTSNFFFRCRLNALEGKRVYFPLVFSLFNPEIVYPNFLNKSVPKTVRSKISIHDHTGWWRDFGYGMSCFIKSDYDQVGGFGPKLLNLAGWGDEDVALFRKFAKSPNLMVVRAIDPGIFHLYHPKHCDARVIGKDRYKHCLASQARNELSHSQLGVICLRDGKKLI